MKNKDLARALELVLSEVCTTRTRDVLAGDRSPELTTTLRAHIGQLRKTYGKQLEGTPEEAYLNQLFRRYQSEGGDDSGRARPSAEVLPAHLQETLDVKVIDIPNFAVGARRKMMSANITYLGELVNRTWEELEEFHPFFDLKSLKHVTRVLNDMGLRLGMETEYVPPEEREGDNS